MLRSGCFLVIKMKNNWKIY